MLFGAFLETLGSSCPNFNPCFPRDPLRFTLHKWYRWIWLKKAFLTVPHTTHLDQVLQVLVRPGCAERSAICGRSLTPIRKYIADLESPRKTLSNRTTHEGYRGHLTYPFLDLFYPAQGQITVRSLIRDKI